MGRSRRPLLLFALAATALLGASSAASAIGPGSIGPDSTGAATIRKVALGVSVKNDRSLMALDNFTMSVGRSPALWSIWSDWGGTDRAFPGTAFLDALRTRGVVPMIVWQPADPAHYDSPSYRYDRIIAGYFDTYIRNWAQAAKAWGGRVILRFAHEMNGYWFPWGTEGRFDNTPPKFIKAWRHIWTIIRGPAPGGVGASNVKFLWSPGSPCQRCQPYSLLYPGDKFVDYVGFTAFNWGSPQPWIPMAKKFTHPMTELAKVSSKPVIAAETGSSRLGGDKPAWIRIGYPAVYTKFPKIKAIVYFDLDLRAVGQPNWLLTSPMAALTEYRAVVAKPKFQGKIP